MKYPVLRINDLHIIRFDSEGDLNRMREREFGHWRKGIETFFVDSSCDRYGLKEIKKLRRSYNPLNWIGSAGSMLLVEHVVERSTHLTFDEIREIVVKLIAKKGWYHQGGENEKQFRTAFDKFKTIDELISNISFYGKWQG